MVRNYVAKIALVVILRYVELQNQDFDSHDFLASLGEADLKDYDLYDKFPIKSVQHILDGIYGLAEDNQCFFLKLGLDGVASKIGSYSFFLQNSPSFKDLLYKSSQFSHIITDLISSIELQVKPTHIEVIYNLSRASSKLPNRSLAAIMEISFGGLTVLYREMTFAKAPQLEFYSAHSHELADEEISRMLGHKFKSQTQKNCIIVPNTALDIENSRYEVDLPITISHSLSKHLEAHNDGSMVAIISNLLEVNPSSSLEDISDSLHISKRTLQRRLKDQNINFTSLKQSVANQRSIELLETSKHSVEEVAKILGYSSTATFVHAFTKWQGLTPSAFLKKIKK